MPNSSLYYFLHQQLPADHEHHGLISVLDALMIACKKIADQVGRGALAGILGTAGSENVQGETQKKLDIISNQIILDECRICQELVGLASEEMDEIVPLTHETPAKKRYLLLFDPLDGSSNIDVNINVGTIFSILPCPDEVVVPTLQDFLQPGKNQVCAGYVIYGPSTQLVLTLGQGTHGFTLDRSIGEFRLTHPNIQMPEKTREFAINTSNSRFWQPPVQRYINECLAGKTGPRGEDFNMRWVGAMVADIHRILMRGGIFMYPRDTKDLTKPGRLRLLYEVSPMSFLVNQANGLSTTGYEWTLDVQPNALHQRIGLIIGSKEEVLRVVSYHQE